jgi:hypothetical protein
MNPAAQLARIAELVPDYRVKIYKLSRACDVWMWLCQTCLEIRKSQGWEVRETNKPPHGQLKCEGCR